MAKRDGHYSEIKLQSKKLLVEASGILELEPCGAAGFSWFQKAKSLVNNCTLMNPITDKCIVNSQ